MKKSNDDLAPNPEAPPLRGFTFTQRPRVRVSDVLERAYRLLRDEGWTQGAWDDESYRCIMGAIAAAADDLGLRKDSLIRTEASRYVLQATGARSVPSLNDSKRRTLGQVLGAMSTAVELAISSEA